MRGWGCPGQTRTAGPAAVGGSGRQHNTAVGEVALAALKAHADGHAHICLQQQVLQLRSRHHLLILSTAYGREHLRQLAAAAGRACSVQHQRADAQKQSQPSNAHTLFRSFSSSVSLKAASSSLLYGGSSSLGSQGICAGGQQRRSHTSLKAMRAAAAAAAERPPRRAAFRCIRWCCRLQRACNRANTPAGSSTHLGQVVAEADVAHKRRLAAQPVGRRRDVHVPLRPPLLLLRVHRGSGEHGGLS